MNQIVTTAVVLSRTNFAEADRIITVLTSDQGRIRLMAKGARKVKSKLAGGIELFSVCDITYIKGKGDISTLISSRLKVHFGQIVTDIDRTMFGYEALKRLNKTVEDNAGPEYFELLQATLDGLNNLHLSIESIELWLSAQLLKLAGHSPNLKTDTSGRKLKPDQSYGFDLEKMAFMAKDDGRYAANHIKLLRLALSLESPVSLKQINNLENVMPECLTLIKSISNQ